MLLVSSMSSPFMCYNLSPIFPHHASRVLSFFLVFYFSKIRTFWRTSSKCEKSFGFPSLRNKRSDSSVNLIGFPSAISLILASFRRASIDIACLKHVMNLIPYQSTFHTTYTPRGRADRVNPLNQLYEKLVPRSCSRSLSHNSRRRMSTCSLPATFTGPGR